MIQNHMIKAGTVVPRLKVADPHYNADEIINIIEKQKDCGLLVFPELCISGYTCADLFQNRTLLEGCLDALQDITKATKEICGLTIFVGMPILYENALYNCAVAISQGEVLAVIPKVHVPMYGEFYEGRWFTSGKSVIGRTINLNGKEVPFGIDILLASQNHTLIGAEICEDLWVPDKPGTHACLAGAEIMVNLSASDELIGKSEYRRNMVAMQSASCYCGYLYVSSGSGESSTDLVFSGHSIIAENGTILKESIFEDKPCVTTALIDIDRIRYNRIHQNTYASEDNDWYRHVPCAIKTAGESAITVSAMKDVLVNEDYFVAKNPFVPNDDAERGRRCKQILHIQASGLATRVRSTGIHNLVIGISGGLDSTLALVVCHEAKKIEPSIHILAITMPNRGNTTSHTYNNALTLMKLLSDEVREIPIEEGVNSHLKDIGHSLSYQGEGDTAYENAQARMRTYILMDIANMENGLVVGTGDLSELALGWCTYNGDHMSMYGVNASVPKTLVQYICRTYAQTCGNDALKEVLISICDTPITPELTPSAGGQIAQKTEEKIGKYDLNDFFLFYTLRYGMDPEMIMALAMKAYDIDLETTKEAILRFTNRFFHQQFKRSCLPDGPKVGSVTLSPRGDWRMPSDASCALWTKKIKEAE